MTVTPPGNRRRVHYRFASAGARRFFTAALALAALIAGRDAAAQTASEKDATLVQLQETVDGLFANLKSPQVTPEAALAEFMADGPLAANEQHKKLEEETGKLKKENELLGVKARQYEELKKVMEGI